ncbi:A24 family peptidase [Nocardia sp. NPDC001965]
MTIIGYLALAAWCAALSISDIRSRRLPDSLTVSGAVTVLGYAALAENFLAAGRGAALLTAPYLLIHLIRPAALGAGDVKLAVGLGAAAGLGGGQAWACSALVAPVLTAAAGAGTLLGHGAGRRIYGHARYTAGPRAPAREHPQPAIAHGPSMCAATLLGLMPW